MHARLRSSGGQRGEMVKEGWKAIEKQYGPNSKTAGRVYCRNHKPGFTGARYSSVTSPTAIIKVQCEDNGLDFDVMIAALYRCREEKAEEQKEVTRREAEARGKLQGEARESAIARFRERVGDLKGPLVYCFKGWTTR